MLSMRVSTHPTLASAVRIRLQSSIGMDAAGFSGVGAWGVAGLKACARGMERASQVVRRLRRRQWRGGPIRACDLVCVCRRRRGGTAFEVTDGAEIGDAWLRGISLWPITSTFAFSGTCQKLGEVRFGSVWTLSNSKTVAEPWDGYCDALSAIWRRSAICSGVRSWRMSAQASTPWSVRTFTNRCLYSRILESSRRA